MTMLQPLRLGFKSSTCTFAVEYRNEATGQNQLYAMALAQKLQMYPNDHVLVQVLQQELKADLGLLDQGKISQDQLLGFMKNARARSTEETLSRLPKGDYNGASVHQLKLAKNQMNQIFQQKVVKPTDANYVYNKQIEFDMPTEDSEWD